MENRFLIFYQATWRYTISGKGIVAWNSVIFKIWVKNTLELAFVLKFTFGYAALLSEINSQNYTQNMFCQE